MKKFFLFLILAPALIVAKEHSDSNTVTITVSNDIVNCVNQIYNNPDAFKYLLQTLLSDREKFRETYNQIINDPAMKNVIIEIRNLMRDEKGVLEKKKQRDADVNKDDTDMTYLLIE